MSQISQLARCFGLTVIQLAHKIDYSFTSMYLAVDPTHERRSMDQDLFYASVDRLRKLNAEQYSLMIEKAMRETSKKEKTIQDYINAFERRS